MRLENCRDALTMMHCGQRWQKTGDKERRNFQIVIMSQKYLPKNSHCNVWWMDHNLKTNNLHVLLKEYHLQRLPGKYQVLRHEDHLVRIGMLFCNYGSHRLYPLLQVGGEGVWGWLEKRLAALNLLIGGHIIYSLKRNKLQLRNMNNYYQACGKSPK